MRVRLVGAYQPNANDAFRVIRTTQGIPINTAVLDLPPNLDPARTMTAQVLGNDYALQVQ